MSSNSNDIPLVKVTIDGQELQVPQGSMIIEAADNAGIRIPRFCYHKKLSVAANCRMCLVDVENARKPTPACASPVTDGMKVFTQSEKAIKYQKAVMEFLLINHPLDCPICDQGGECELQDVAMGYGKDVSRFAEGKRSVQDKDIGPLIATDLTRCIHCTRCVRFGIEVSGQRELGMTGRGEHVEIGTFLERNVDSEVSGNVIDLCPVGALTAKPSRYQARPWELSQKPSIAPHDCLGSQIYGHVRRNHLVRVVPKDQETINEVWLSDRDRFSYEAVHSAHRLKEPMIKRGGEWEAISWEKAFEEIVDRLQAIQSAHSTDKIGALLSPSSTLEEAYLLQKIMRTIGSNHIDYRLRISDERLNYLMGDAPGIDCSPQYFEETDAALLVGCHLRYEVPLLHIRLRKAALSDAKIMMVNPLDTEPAMPMAVHSIVDDHIWVEWVAGILKQVCKERPEAASKYPELQAKLEPIAISEEASAMAKHLLSAERPLIILGALALNHKDAAWFQSMVLILKELLNAKGGVLTEGANARGLWLAGAIPHRDATGRDLESKGASAFNMLTGQAHLKALFLLGIEPELDSAWGLDAIKTLKAAECVIALSAFDTPALRDYATLLLPISTFAENEGTYVNVAGTFQTFNAMQTPQDQVKPAWKVLRVLANFLGLEGFEFQTNSEVAQEFLRHYEARQNVENFIRLPEVWPAQVTGLYHRVAPVAIYATDATVRQSKPLQNTHLAKHMEGIRMSPHLAQKLNVKAGDHVKCSAGEGASCSLEVMIDHKQPNHTVCVPMGLSSTCHLSYDGRALTLVAQSIQSPKIREATA